MTQLLLAECRCWSVVPARGSQGLLWGERSAGSERAPTSERFAVRQCQRFELAVADEEKFGVRFSGFDIRQRETALAQKRDYILIVNKFHGPAAKPITNIHQEAHSPGHAMADQA